MQAMAAPEQAGQHQNTRMVGNNPVRHERFTKQITPRGKFPSPRLPDCAELIALGSDRPWGRCQGDLPGMLPFVSRSQIEGGDVMSAVREAPVITAGEKRKDGNITIRLSGNSPSCRWTPVDRGKRFASGACGRSETSGMGILLPGGRRVSTA